LIGTGSWPRRGELSELELGLIQGFEFTHELAWNLLKDYLTHQGISQIVGSRDATRLAFQNGLIVDAEIWMEMIRLGNQSSRTCNLKQALATARDGIDRFHPACGDLKDQFAALAEAPR
jgi:nucleotidyltransferase substrate binding protein (TIGR01987 family)